MFFKKKVREILSNIALGKPQTRIDKSAHVPGVREGNHRGFRRHERGIHPKEDRATATASRSTGINPFARNSIVPGAPRLTPP